MTNKTISSTVDAPDRPSGLEGTAELRTLASLVADQIARTPDAVAVLDGDREITYRDLDRRVDAIAAALHRGGVRRGDLVAVHLPRNADIIAAVLAPHRIGAGYLPLDPDYPTDRLRFTVDDARPRAVLCTDRTAGQVRELLPPATPTAVLGIDALPDGRPPAVGPAAPQDVAYVIYTSGSTGRPKGAVLEHRNTVAMLDWVRAEFTPQDMAGVLFGTSICFDLSVFEIFGTLTMGGTVVVAPNALALPELPNRDRVTLLNTVPAVTASLLHDGPLPPSVRTVVHSGDTTTRALADAIYAVPTVAGFYNLYGPTEAVTWQAGALIDRSSTGEPPIGVPFPRVGIHLLDADQRPVPAGTTGELYLSGPQVCRGYLNRPELTAEKFLSLPEVTADRCYRTGDLAVLGEDGQLRYRGRTDFQVKVRGFRVELGEIEAVLERHPDVQDAVATAVRTEGTYGTRIVAYAQVAGRPTDDQGARSAPADGLLRGPTIDRLRDELSAALHDALPDYMCPNSIALLATLPLTENGKPDRTRLPEVPTERAGSAGGRVPEGLAEQQVAAIWAEVLGRSEVAADVPLAAIGGDSLHAAGIVSRIRHRLDAPLALSAVRADSTVAGIAAAVDVPPGRRHPDAATSGRSITTADGAVAPTWMQSEFWLGDQVAGADSAAWTVPILLSVAGRLDVPALQAALDELVVRHTGFRTAMPDVETAIRLDPCPVPLQAVDLTDLPAAERRVEADRVEHAESVRPISASDGRLLRAVLVTLAPDRSELLLHAHHLAVDGLSTGPLLAELAELYRCRAAGLPPPPPPTVTFDDAAAWLRKERSAAQVAAARDHWRARLRGTPADQGLPGGHGDRSADPWVGGRVHRPLDPQVLARLRAFGRSAGVTDYPVLLAAAAVRLHRETGRTDVLLSAPAATRRHPDLEQVVGLLIETMPVRCDLRGNPTFAELVERIARTVADDLEHGALPWREMTAGTELQRSGPLRSREMVIAMQRGVAPVTSGGITWGYLRELDNGGAKSDFSLFWEADAPRPQIAAEFAAERLTAAEATDLLEQVVTVADAGARSPHTRIGDLDWLTPDEHRRLGEFSGAEALQLDPAAASVLEQVIARGAETPDSVAVDCPRSGSVTYRQLLAGARRVADALSADLPPPEVPIAVAARRGAASIAGMLGCWLVGRGYLPLDVTHPSVRLAGILADSGVTVLLADDGCPQIPPADPPTTEHAAPPRRVMLTDLLPDRPERWPAPDEVPLPPQDRAPGYRIYTSGSTGRPKGVNVGGRALAGFLVAIGSVVPVTSDDVVAHLTTVSFDIAGLEVWLPLTRGARIRVVDETTTKDGFALAHRLAGVTTIQMTPTGWQVLLAAGWSGGSGVRALVGGEAVPPKLAGELVSRVGQAWNVYGPTETTIWSTAHRITAADAQAAAVPVGRPLPNTVLHMLDHRGHPVPPGVLGEICIGGSGVADGYHDRPDLTSDRFVALPGLATESAPDIFYRTGDLGRWSSDGLLEYVGRSDGQVKIRGVRLEIGEIEAALERIPGVRAGVVGVDGAGPSARLVGYLVADPVADDTAVERLLRAELPPTHVPDTWVRLAALPQTPNGKIDRAALPPPGEDADSYREPVSDMEQIVADIWCDVLSTDRVGRDDRFLALGGHSLSATRVTALLRDDLDIDVPVRLLFEYPRLRDYAAQLADLLLLEVGR